jgi:hypothetical protein
MTTANSPMRPRRCLRPCDVAARYPAHHNRLLAVDTDTDALLELLEIAVSWHELDYSQAAVVGPGDWSRFAEEHRWTLPERAERAFSLALDIVGRHGIRPEEPLAEVIPLPATR